MVAEQEILKIPILLVIIQVLAVVAAAEEVMLGMLAEHLLEALAVLEPHKHLTVSL